jgi:hypothetical protein
VVTIDADIWKSIIQAFTPVAILLISFAFRIQEANRRLMLIVCVSLLCNSRPGCKLTLLFQISTDDLFWMRHGCVRRIALRDGRLRCSVRGCSIRSFEAGHDSDSLARHEGKEQICASLYDHTNWLMPLACLPQMDPIVSLHYYAPVCATINACIIPFTEGFAPFREIGRIGFFVLFTNAGIAFALNVSFGF